MKNYLPGLIAALVTGLCLFVYYENRKVDEVQPLPAVVQPPEVPAHALANGEEPLGPGIYDLDSKSTVQINNGASTDVLIKLVINNKGNKKLIRCFYVPKGNSFISENLPEGSYQIVYSYGLDWNEKGKHFNRRQSFSVADKRLEIRKTKSEVEGGTQINFSGYTIDLKGVPDGNFPAHKVSEQAFNEI